MRIVVFGAGSLGSALGALLARKNEVILVGRRANVLAIQSSGLNVIGDASFKVRVEAHESAEGLEPPELLIMSTKSYDTLSAIDACRGFVGKDAMVLTLQNGLGNLEALRKWRGRLAFGGTTTMGANLVSPGKVRVSGLGRTIIGSDRDPPGARMIARAFSESGLPSSVRSAIQGEIWAKAVISSCINPLTAILRVPNGMLLESPAIYRMLADVCRESESVARSSGIRLPYSSMVARVRAVAKDTRNNRSSMLRDIERGKRTEIAYINGALVRHGLSKKVRTPLNLTLLAMVESLEATVTPEKA